MRILHSFTHTRRLMSAGDRKSAAAAGDGRDGGWDPEEEEDQVRCPWNRRTEEEKWKELNVLDQREKSVCEVTKGVRMVKGWIHRRVKKERGNKE